MYRVLAHLYSKRCVVHAIDRGRNFWWSNWRGGGVDVPISSHYNYTNLNIGATILTLLSVVTSTGSGRKTSHRSAVALRRVSAAGVVVMGPVRPRRAPGLAIARTAGPITLRSTADDALNIIQQYLDEKPE